MAASRSLLCLYGFIGYLPFLSLRLEASGLRRAPSHGVRCGKS